MLQSSFKADFQCRKLQFNSFGSCTLLQIYKYCLFLSEWLISQKIMSTDKFQCQLLQLATLNQKKAINLKGLNADMRAMLVKRTKDQKRTQWIANKGNYSKWKLRQFLEAVEQAKIYKLQLSKNYQKNIIKHIYHIRFTRLQFLVIQHSWLNSCELLPYLDAPVLREINLKNNEIAHLKPLRKLVNPNTKVLRLNLHKFISNFSQMHQYNRCTNIIAREILNYHVGSVFSERIKKILKKRCAIYPIEKDKLTSTSSSDSD